LTKEGFVHNVGRGFHFLLARICGATPHPSVLRLTPSPKVGRHFYIHRYDIKLNKYFSLSLYIFIGYLYISKNVNKKTASCGFFAAKLIGLLMAAYFCFWAA
jgi:hypothetical protein